MIGLTVLLAASLSAGNAEFDRTAAEGAARIAVARFTADLAKTGPAAGELTQAMLADPTAFGKRREAENLCRNLYSNSVDRIFQAEADAVRQRLGLAADFPLELKASDWTSLMEPFPARFADERQAAVTEQAKGIVTATRPTEAEFETKDDVDLRREMADRIAAEQKTAVFEENRAYISDRLVAPILASGWEERNRQSDYVKRARSDAAVPTKLTQALCEKLAANVAEKMKGVEPSKAWGVFPSVRDREVPAEVERRLERRFLSSVDAETLELSVDEVAAVIAQNPAAHVKASDSERLFAEIYAERVLTQAVTRVVGEAAVEDRAELRAFLTPRLTGEPCRKAVDRVVRREVMPKWKAARAEVARRVAAETWPSLVDGTWFPVAQLADDLSARSDFGAAVRAWRTLGELAALAKADGGKPMLEEAAGTADGRISAAFERARNAIAAQNAIVDAVHPAVLDEARKGSKDLKSVIEKLLSATIDRWDETRLTTLWPNAAERPANANAQHVDLFPSVLKKIELVARQILDELIQEQQPKPEEKKPEEKPEDPPEETPPEETPEDSPEETPPEEDMLFSLSVKRDGSNLEIKLLQGKKVVEESRIPANAKDFKSAMEQLTRVISNQVLLLK